MKSLPLYYACLSVLYETATATTTSAPVVDLGYARYRGLVDYETNVTSYLGVRFAAPPTGDLRWRAPQPPSFQPGVQDAIAQPVQCIQASLAGGPTNPLRDAFQGLPSERSIVNFAGSEDCLFLNVFAPSKPASSEPLPVIFWIHGGGYHIGDVSTYPGHPLIHHGQQGVIVVMIQYRLGLFGFLPGKDVKAHGALNTGLLDQEFAMKWVQEHISKFGGDPNQVTIWGQSAGAGSVLLHLLARDGKIDPPLYQRAILSSTFLPSQYRYDDPESEMLYEEVVKRSDCSSLQDTMACLRSTDVSVLAAAGLDIGSNGFYGTFLFSPVVDGEFSTQSPVKALKEQKVNPVNAMLSMTTTEEGSMFANPRSNLDAAGYIQQLYPRINETVAEAGARLYAGLGSPYEQHSAIYGETVFICPTYYLHQTYKDATAFKGTFAVAPGMHIQDMPYYFTGLKLILIPIPPVFENEAFKTAFVQSSLSVARFGDPNHRPGKYETNTIWTQEQDDLHVVPNAQKVFNPNVTTSITAAVEDILPQWESYSPRNTEMWFGITDDDEPDVRAIETDPQLLERCRFWENIAELTAQ